MGMRREQGVSSEKYGNGSDNTGESDTRVW